MEKKYSEGTNKTFSKPNSQNLNLIYPRPPSVILKSLLGNTITKRQQQQQPSFLIPLKLPVVSCLIHPCVCLPLIIHQLLFLFPNGAVNSWQLINHLF